LNAARQVFRDNPLRVTAVSSFGHLDPRFREVEEGVAVTLEFSGGRLAQFYAGFGTDAFDMYQILGTKGSLTLSNAFRFGVARRLAVQRGNDAEVIDFAETDNFSGMIAYFSDCVRKGETPLADGREGLADMQAMIAIEAASKSGKPQGIPASPPFRTYGSGMVRSFPPAREKLLV